MQEQVLLDYLQHKISVDELATNLKEAQQKTSYDTTSVYVDKIENDGEFKVKREHLLRLCNEVIDGRITLEDLNTIAFVILMSEYFTHDHDDEIADRVLFDWDNPEIGFPLSLDNMQKWKILLESDEDVFDSRELKE
ncbi:hypothetical protein FRZ67_15210 [Panacibacter ginsenosidivorans]|uniref:Uncharacterized protein n=1 Tax=Panacibacter ginsenosidivorans TaxID=1813871 RepID=A0A5B8VAS4_9BACT|nr:hypothetical protein [Panacibacter ginsenosidivorans]QEC68590.1 hypothetical protein FRZ67_15210 [Panacibacter ginsenosidivorans]